MTLGRLPGTAGLYRNRRIYPVTYSEPGLLLLRIDAPTLFFNAAPIRDSVRRKVKRARQDDGGLRWVILSLSPVTGAACGAGGPWAR